MVGAGSAAPPGSLEVFTTSPLEKGGIFVFSASPFVHKLLSYLALARVDFVVRGVTAKGNPTPPKGKYPFVRFPTGEVLGDSQLIVEELERRRSPDEQMDAWLTPQQRALSHVVRRTLEESTTWNAITQRRWGRKENFYGITLPLYLDGAVPRLLQPLLGCIMRRGVLRASKGQGMGRHSNADLLDMGVEDIAAIEVLFPSGGPFFHGERPSTIDAVLHAFVGALRFQLAAYSCEAWSPEAEVNLRCPKLRAHCAHMDALLGPQLREVLATQ